ncbi:hypothetical protein BLA24_09345 [Streptomyces cinnamoneus]|uniref:Uncharacterized protein n=1 Tax=Streptomyces cinnamoneus TaxID=53446 RepID=A0A2G1XLM0_STRCJ|nr:hypothetical protein [Streptomyces cinnamoneus]PHQ52117.1 hypothetical protein BLA24_09345 [Streptomyces cinnamoneus]PPT16197.1 hypothetical protein CYQ11_27955 [Streptomyces cinnamoneus]
MSVWGRVAVPQSVSRAAVALLAAVLLVLSGAASEVVGNASLRDEVPAEAPLLDLASDECAACAPEQYIPRPGRAGRPTGGRDRPPVLASAAGGAGGLSGAQAVPPRPGDAIAAADRARHFVLRC